ncbi:LCP family protein [Candidatus Gottesmanbacteria bacterium]|nr:LCP family protein [Candidatus Gottesmanbacteria bacterium]
MQPKVRRFIMPKAKIAGSVIAVALLLVVIVKIAAGFVGFMHQIAVTLKSSDNRTNVLLLGIPGGIHEGADLTDSMMVLSFQHKTKTLTLISLPRDIWSDTLKDKINSAYHYGEEKKKGGGMLLAKVIAEDVVGIPIQYGLVVDFSGFRRVLDDVGGITVLVAQTFTDSEFPIEGKEDDPCDGDPKFRCRFETIHFEAGKQHMDGITGLTYVRSRHAEGEEGSDFARGRRQQEVIVALKTKLTSPLTWLPPGHIGRILESLDAATDTDMKLGELLTFGKLVARVKADRISRVSIEDQLTSPPLWMYGGKYVLVPKEDFVKLHDYVRQVLER